MWRWNNLYEKWKIRMDSTRINCLPLTAVWRNWGLRLCQSWFCTWKLVFYSIYLANQIPNWRQATRRWMQAILRIILGRKWIIFLIWKSVKLWESHRRKCAKKFWNRRLKLSNIELKRLVKYCKNKILINYLERKS